MSTVWCHLQEGGKCLQFGVTYRRGVSVLQFGVTDRRGVSVLQFGVTDRRGVSVYSLMSLTGGGQVSTVWCH